MKIVFIEVVFSSRQQTTKSSVRGTHLGFSTDVGLTNENSDAGKQWPLQHALGTLQLVKLLGFSGAQCSKVKGAP